MDRNPLLQARYTPVAIQGEITGKFFPDYDELDERRANSKNASALKTSYPGGGNDDNLAIMPGEPVFGLKDRRAEFLQSGEPSEMGLSSVAGLNYGVYGNNREATERDYYFIGVSKTELRIGSNDVLEHGGACLKAGLMSVENSGPLTIYAGSLIGWRFPLIPTDPNYKGNSSQMGSVVYGNRGGTPNTKFRPELVPFDYTDYQSNLGAAFMAMKKTSNSVDGIRGVSDLPIEALFQSFGAEDSNGLSPLQEEAMGYKFGLVGVVLRGIDYLKNNSDLLEGNEFSGASIAQALGLWNTGDMSEQLSGLIGHILGPNLPTNTPEREALDFPNDFDPMGPSDTPEDRYQKLSYMLMTILLGGASASWYIKTSKILGKAANTAAPSDTLDVIFGHFKP